jgi:AraC-like DNA-binding protein
MANFTGRSLATFKRDFKKLSSLSPEKWLIQKRLEVAQQKLRNGDKKVSEVCYEVGFKNLSHFSKVYKKAFGAAPSK